MIKHKKLSMTKLDPPQSPAQYRPYSEVLKTRRVQLLSKIITSPPGSAAKSVTFKPGTIEPISNQDVRRQNPEAKRRSGQPKTKWVEKTLENF